MTYDDVWLVVPLFNEGQVIGDVVRTARDTFPHVVCVDDGSPTAARRRRRGRRGGRASPGQPRPGSRAADRLRVRPQRPDDALGRHLRRRRPAPGRGRGRDGRAGPFGAPRRGLRLPLPRRAHRGRLPQGPGAQGRRRLHEPHDGHAADRRPQRVCGSSRATSCPPRHHAEPHGPRLGARGPDRRRSTSATPRAPSTSSTPTTRGPRASRCGTPSTSSPTSSCDEARPDAEGALCDEHRPHPGRPHRRRRRGRGSAVPLPWRTQPGPAPHRPAAFAGFAVVSILFPDVWNRIATFVGVSRGTDVVLYALVVAFLSFTVTTYLRFRDMEIALHPARPPDRPRRGRWRLPRRPAALRPAGPGQLTA